MKIKTLIIDDEPIALEKMKSYVDKIPFLQLAGECMSAAEAMQILAEEDIDVVFTDINMPDLDGMDFIGSLSRPPMVVFVTAYPQYALESYRLSAVDYLLKPYSFADFRRAADKVLRLCQDRKRSAPAPAATAPESLFVKVDYKYVRVTLSDIRYIKGYGEYLQIFLRDVANPLLTLSSFAAILEKLDPSRFIQIHRSYIVNMDAVERIERSRVIMDADTFLPVGDSYRAAFLDYLSSRSVGSQGK